VWKGPGNWRGWRKFANWNIGSRRTTRIRSKERSINMDKRRDVEI
jgi:hypothetical protein